MSAILAVVSSFLRGISQRLSIGQVCHASLKAWMVIAAGLLLPSLSFAQNSTPSHEVSLVKVSLALLAVIIVLVLVLRLMRRMSGPKLLGQSVARMIGGVNLGARERVVVIEIGKQWIVVGVAPSGLTALATLAADSEVGTGEPIKGPDFSSIIKQVIK